MAPLLREFVRQYLEGTDLARSLRQSGPLPLADAVPLVLQTAEAVAETHGHGIIVRELQPRGACRLQALRTC